MEQRSITVKGVGKASGKPDLVLLPVTLTAKDLDYQKTMVLAAERHDALQAALLACGLDASAVRTTDFSVDTSYENERGADGTEKLRFDGYVCTHRLKLEFDLDTALLGRVMNAIANSAAEPSYGIRFSVKDAEGLRRAALESAAKDARAKAEILAAASGVRLGGLISIGDLGYEASFLSETAVGFSMTARKADAMAVELAPDDVRVTERVAFVWEIH